MSQKAERAGRRFSFFPALHHCRVALTRRCPISLHVIAHEALISRVYTLHRDPLRTYPPIACPTAARSPPPASLRSRGTQLVTVSKKLGPRDCTCANHEFPNEHGRKKEEKRGGKKKRDICHGVPQRGSTLIRSSNRNGVVERGSARNMLLAAR